MPTDYDRNNRSGLYVRKAPISIEQKASLASQVQYREEQRPITLAPVKFLERRLPGEMGWSREAIPLKVLP